MKLLSSFQLVTLIAKRTLMELVH